MEISLLLNALITLLVVLDPPGLVPVFLSLTVGMNKAQRRQTAFVASFISLFILLIFALGGLAILNVIGVSLSAFQIAGGILLFTIAFEMIFGDRTERKEKTAQESITRDHIRNIAAFPLAMPLIAGPGSISATILMAGEHKGFLGAVFALSIIFLAIIVVYAFLLLANPIDRLLGSTGRSIVTRLFGLLLAALAVQFIADGILKLFFPNGS